MACRLTGTTFFLSQNGAKSRWVFALCEQQINTFFDILPFGHYKKVLGMCACAMSCSIAYTAQCRWYVDRYTICIFGRQSDARTASSDLCMYSGGMCGVDHDTDRYWPHYWQWSPGANGMNAIFHYDDAPRCRLFLPQVPWTASECLLCLLILIEMAEQEEMERGARVINCLHTTSIPQMTN